MRIGWDWVNLLAMELDAHIIELAKRLVAKNWRLAIAESCTGGGVAYALTNLAGSSQWFERGLVTYSNQAKHDLLGVSLDLLAEYGAVSQPVAQAMATGVIEHHPVEVSLAITGIAGPAGGSADKPIGTVWFAWAATGLATQSGSVQFQGDRQAIREAAIAHAIIELLKFLG